MSENIPFLKGERIDIVVMNFEHLKIYQKWINDPDVNKYLRILHPETYEGLKKFWFPDHKEIGDNIWFAIWHKKDEKPIGITGLYDIWKTAYRRGHLTLFIGEPEYWGKGLGGEALELIINYAFYKLNYHKVIGEVNLTNTRSLRLCKKLDFIEEGHQKDMEYIDGEWTDIKLLAIFKKDWRKRNSLTK